MTARPGCPIANMVDWPGTDGFKLIPVAGLLKKLGSHQKAEPDDVEPRVVVAVKVLVSLLRECVAHHRDHRHHLRARR